MGYHKVERQTILQSTQPDSVMLPLKPFLNGMFILPSERVSHGNFKNFKHYFELFNVTKHKTFSNIFTSLVDII